MVQTVFKRAWYAKTAKVELYREIVWQCSGRNIALMDKHQPAKAHLCKHDPIGNTENFADLFNLSA